MNTIVPYLKKYFLSGCKPESQLQVGVEWEKIGIYSQDGRAIPYYGPNGVKSIFGSLSKSFKWEPVLSQEGEPIALKKGLASITLEPGGQIELSGQKAFNISNNAQELLNHIREIKKASEPMGISWLGLGAQPFSTHKKIEWVPKDRYKIMRMRLKNNGKLTFAMMKETASVQISLDYTTEEDAIDKLRLSMGLSPILTAIFANSPLENGKFSGYLSRRAHIWSKTDPRRSGILWSVFDKNYSFDKYIEYALKVPMLFIQRNNKLSQIPRMSFSKFMTNGSAGINAKPSDWDLHLTSIFTDARLKKYLEIRMIDCQSAPLGISAVAFIKGLFYNQNARKSSWGLIKNWSILDRRMLLKKAPIQSLKTRIGRYSFLNLARDLLVISKLGLPANERKYLLPLENLIKEELCPAQKLLKCLAGCRSMSSKINKIIQCSSID